MLENIYKVSEEFKNEMQIDYKPVPYKYGVTQISDDMWHQRPWTRCEFDHQEQPWDVFLYYINMPPTIRTTSGAWKLYLDYGYNLNKNKKPKYIPNTVTFNSTGRDHDGKSLKPHGFMDWKQRAAAYDNYINKRDATLTKSKQHYVKRTNFKMVDDLRNHVYNLYKGAKYLYASDLEKLESEGKDLNMSMLKNHVSVTKRLAEILDITSTNLLTSAEMPTTYTHMTEFKTDKDVMEWKGYEDSDEHQVPESVESLNELLENAKKRLDGISEQNKK